MKNEVELVKIGFIAPIVAILILSLWGGVFILVLSPIIWAISSVICIFALCFFHSLFCKYPLIKRFGYLVAVLGGALFGLLFYLLFFWGKTYMLQLAAAYTFVGLLMGSISGLMYFKGPLRVNA